MISRKTKKSATKPRKRPAVRRKPIKRTKMSQVALWRFWGVPDGAYRRWKGMRGIYWYWLSRDVRKKEWEKWDKKCLTCLEPIENWQDGQCGHIIPAAKCGEYLMFHRKNLTIQHAKCNNPRITPQAGLLNAVRYDERYGKGALESLLSQTKLVKKRPNNKQYEQMIRELDSYKDYLANKKWV